MITAIEIENFKAFGERQRIELRPITLLFGPNSGGKSSIGHAMHYLRELLVEGNLDVYNPWSGGEALNLGGIRNLVHGRDPKKMIRFKVDLRLDGQELPRYAGHWTWDRESVVSIRDHLETASIEFEIDPADEPLLKRCTISLNGESFAEITRERKSQSLKLRVTDWFHLLLLPHTGNKEGMESQKLLARIGDLLSSKKDEEIRKELAARNTDLSEDKLDEMLETLHEMRNAGVDFISTGALGKAYYTINQTSPVGVVFDLPAPEKLLPNLLTPLQIPQLEDRLEQIGWQEESAAAEFVELLSTMVLGPLAVLMRRLEDLCYVGPLRDMPPRELSPLTRHLPSQWPTGLQAWHTLAFGSNPQIIEEVSNYLSSETFLKTGYTLSRRSYNRVPSNPLNLLVQSQETTEISKELFAQLQGLAELPRVELYDGDCDLYLHPQDVGVGLSQVIPVLTALANRDNNNVGPAVISIEQPELHLHPRQQASLGNVLIQGMKSTKNPHNRVILIETHSEHLILRLLRRIRETTRGEAEKDQQLTPRQLRIQHVRREGSESKVRVIDVDDNGDFVQPWPDDFFEIDFQERFD
jgi:predicted ATPase